jgi:enoyl-CoA hydratase
VPSLIDLQVDSALATITLRNPARRNAMTRAMWRELRAAVVELNSYANNSWLRTDSLPYSHIRCVIVQGAAGHFCSGGDISEYPEFRFNETSLCAFHEDEVAPALHALLACDVPLIAQIQGNCMGGGLEIAACCDIRIAGQGATFGAPIAKLGMPMAPKELAIVLRAAGEATVREMLLEARSFSAEQMAQRGFVQRVVADDGVAAEALATAQRICALSPQAARLNKQAIRQFFEQNMPLVKWNSAQPAINSVAHDRLNHATHSVSARTEYDAATHAQNNGNPYAYAHSAEHVEGIHAFLQKRSANF